MRLVASLLLSALPLLATAQDAPEIRRTAAVTPQAVGARHSLRTIPEACVRIEGEFTGKAERPYLFQAVNTDPRCHPRARLRDAAEARPSRADGWILNDVIRVPNAGCPAQAAVLTVWRKPSTAAAVGKDRFGATRVNLGGKDDTLRARGGIEALPQYALATNVEGAACR